MLLELQVDQIQPSQDFLKPGTLQYILNAYTGESGKPLPPTPFVREDPDGNYVAIDGHNLIAFYAILGKNVTVYVASNANDQITSAQSPSSDSSHLATRNQELYEKYGLAIAQRDQVVTEHSIHSFSDLLAIPKYQEVISQIREHCLG